MEVELKLVLQTDGLSVIKDKVVPKLQGQFKHKQTELLNTYYDTPDLHFKKHKIGFRVRTQDNRIEQTVKTKGKVIGGLHERPEYNVELEKPVPDLTAFEADIFPEHFDIKAINDQLTSIFSTNFKRNKWLIEQQSGTIELVYDQGEVATDKDKQEINEIELELISGPMSLLYDVAETIASFLPVRIGNQSKAALGYRLLKGASNELRFLPEFLKLKTTDSTEQGLIKAISCALEHWQYHQALFIQDQNIKALNQIRVSLFLLLQSVALYLPVLQSQELLTLHRKLLKLNQQWSWTEELSIFQQLRSKKGPFSQRIPKDAGIMNYLLGRKEGLLKIKSPEQMVTHSDAIKIQLLASRIIIERPWREQNDGAEIPVRKHANGWLSQTWQTVIQSLPTNHTMDEHQYLALEVMLQQTLINGFLVGDLFAETRGTFRAPWLDLQRGIEELKALALLSDSSHEFDLQEPEDFSEWLSDKKQSLLRVMEMSRKVAMQAEIYW